MGDWEIGRLGWSRCTLDIITVYSTESNDKDQTRPDQTRDEAIALIVASFKVRVGRRCQTVRQAA